MSIAALVITDGRRDCLERTLASFEARVASPEITERWLYDDSGDAAHRAWLHELAPSFQVFSHPDGRQGFGGAIRHAWYVLRKHGRAPHIFHLEDDFTFNRNVDLAAMRTVLDGDAKMAQMALRRQAWNDNEKAAGGLIEQHPDWYEQFFNGDAVWLEHTAFFTTNPCLYRRELLDIGWPDVAHSEGIFSIQLRELGFKFGFWGERTDTPWVHHIGDQRAGTGY